MQHLLFKIIYAIFYIFSLLPLRVLYVFSDIIAFVLRDIFQYRKKVVLDNLQIAFPEKTQQERDRIAHEFYTRFCDSFLETLKLISISKEALSKRFVCDLQLLEDLHASSERSITLALGHFFNWEMANLAVSLQNPYKQLLVYKKVENYVFENMMLQLRGRFQAALLPTEDFQSRFRSHASEKYCLILVADQNPYKHRHKAFWTTFFGRLVPFVKGPEKGAVINGNAVVFGKLTRLKRGYYKNELVLITANASETRRGEITKKMAGLIEENIKADPANYLWSHRRFKFVYSEENARNLIQ